MSFFDWMRTYQVPLEVSSLDAVVAACCAVANETKANEIVSIMKESKIAPSLHTLTPFVQLRARQATAVSQILTEIDLIRKASVCFAFWLALLFHVY